MSGLSHINERGEAQMVDVGDKPIAQRNARAEGRIEMKQETLDLLRSGQTKKGDVIATARIAGIMATKRTHDLIPLCHQLALSKVDVDFEELNERVGLRVTSEVRVNGQTGVEMEALTAVTVACLTLYDMLKAVDRSMVIAGVRVIEKSGGRSGHFEADTSGDN
ncbi:MAG: cyclic pyranopterin monophosphate synthase MoaC [Hyphomicrobiaceae bacterium TMED74]|nr:cyclic pyranopterin monophosphate synthase MoaC [Filomicrobium sp.]RPG45575.1 MAG: cyclic pyranopterin monophosphate synthase MoaC [Hyphomicrobiaceae bacterium TMED74]